MAPKPPEIRIGMVGLDTSHCIEFAKAFQGEVPPEQKISGLKVVTAMRFPSIFQTEEGQDKRQEQLERMGVKVVRTLEETVKDKDAIMLEINDPALHEEYFRKVVALVPHRPMFLDKPLAGTMEAGRKIIELARTQKVNIFGCSGVRFLPALETACSEITRPLLCHMYGWYNKAPAGSSYIWYGVHAMELIERAMGRGAKSVYCHEDARGIVAIIQYDDERRAVAELCTGLWDIGGRLQTADKTVQFHHPGGSFNFNMLLKLRDFFVDGGDPPVALEDMLEIQALLDAGDRSLASGADEAVRR
jgi:predicted dehydrogenase